MDSSKPHHKPSHNHTCNPYAIPTKETGILRSGLDEVSLSLLYRKSETLILGPMTIFDETVFKVYIGQKF